MAVPLPVSSEWRRQLYPDVLLHAPLFRGSPHVHGDDHGEMSAHGQHPGLEAACPLAGWHWLRQRTGPLCPPPGVCLGELVQQHYHHLEPLLSQQLLQLSPAMGRAPAGEEHQRHRPFLPSDCSPPILLVPHHSECLKLHGRRGRDPRPEPHSGHLHSLVPPLLNHDGGAKDFNADADFLSISSLRHPPLLPHPRSLLGRCNHQPQTYGDHRVLCLGLAGPVASSRRPRALFPGPGHGHHHLILLQGWSAGFLDHHQWTRLCQAERLKADAADRRGGAASECQAPKRHPAAAHPGLHKMDQQSPGPSPATGRPLIPILQHQGAEGNGLSNLMRLLEGIVFPLQNSISVFRNYPRILTAVICLGGFLGSLIFTSRAGSYIMYLFDDLVVPLSLVITVVFQNVALAWIYGAGRFREEMFSEMGRPLWPFSSFLWCYVTLPGLLALLTICFTQLFQGTHLYYTAWNASGSKEVKHLYPRNSLGWVIFLSVLTFLPIPVHPLHQWWSLQEYIAPDPFEKLMSKKTPMVSSMSSQRPQHHSMKSQERTSNASTRGLSMFLLRSPKPEPECLSQDPVKYESSSWFSLPILTSLSSSLTIRSASLHVSRQVSPTSVTTDNSNKGSETQEESPKKKSVQ
ncbi:uncharacterized protein [Odocoileus virginianus]|uniref:Uncharacterized protein isoform X12 n=1 Tax=Odocoileus virginianus TaxID=9874 RepID=A0A6J0WU57_ODOVR|nr:uncharacterized protein LOC110132355 isoform X13 [Odocoileus virginianus texanus]